MKVLFTIICITVSLVCKGQSIKYLSNDIYKKQIDLWGVTDSLDYYNEKKILKLDRDKSKWNNYLDFSIQSDTIFFLQWWDIQGSSGLTIWNRKDTVCYYISSSSNSYKPIENRLFSDMELFTFSLISNWSIDKIMKYEKDSDDNIILPRLMNYMTRVIFNGRKYRIDCFRYRDFRIEGEDY